MLLTNTPPVIDEGLLLEALDLPFDSGHNMSSVADEDVGISLFCANKLLSLEVPKNNSLFFGTLITTTYGESIPGSTTALYEHSRKILGHFATRTELPINYAFSTRNESMIRWARTHGERIFDWAIDTDTPSQYRATTIIPPDSNT